MPYIHPNKGLPKRSVNLYLGEYNAPLADEFKYLYASIFKNPENYIKIIETLASKKSRDDSRGDN